MRKNVLFILLGILLAACQPDTVCRQDSEILCYLHCQDTAATTVKDTSFALRSDVNEMRIPLTFQNLSDTLFIHYANEYRYISMACGNFIYHELDSVSTSGAHLSSVCINEARVENYQATHIVMTYTDVK